MVDPAQTDLFTALVTSDYQVKTRWGHMGFENQYWDKTKISDIIGLEEPRVDVDHKRKNTYSGYILDLEFLTCEDYSRVQGEWTAPKHMDCAIATMWTFKGTAARRKMTALLKSGLGIGVSIEHGGRKPKRTIGPCITVTHCPQNHDAWVITGAIAGKFYSNLYPKNKTLPDSVLNCAREQYERHAEQVFHTRGNRDFIRAQLEWEPGGSYYKLLNPPCQG
jgi:hypothetical protein